jgi:tetratricopeptide (TPR) repeat protein
MLRCPSPHAFAVAHLRAYTIVFALLVFAPLALAEDWQSRVRTCVQNKDLPAAITIVEQRLQAAPEEVEARGWHGRLLAWTGKWEAAEAEYRYVLQQAPNDVDILSGLADVLIWREHFDEALAVLNDAQALAPNRADILLRQGRVLRSLRRNSEAKSKFLTALALEPGNADAQQGLESLRPEPRHELRFGTDNDLYNYTDAAYAQGISLTSKWNPRWSTSFAQTTYQRFGQDAAQFSGSTTWRYTAHNALTVGGAVAHDSGVIPRAQAFLELGRGFTISREGIVRGIETSYQQRWLWFADARVLALTATARFYLPNDFTWSISITPARSRFPLTEAAWQTSGLTRLSFPLFPRVVANAFYAVGTENFAQQDQIGRFSARTMGGGTRIQLTTRQDITGYIANQDRSQGRAQISLGMSYGIRF